MSRFAPSITPLVDYPGGSPPDRPSVTLVLPLFNEVKHVRAVVGDVIAQDYAYITAIHLVDGLSDDGTLHVLREMETNDARITVSSNPRRTQAAALNLAFSRATSDVVMRLDGHARYSKDVVSRSIEALTTTGAAGVGAIQRQLPADTVMGRSIVAAHTSPFGIGVARHRRTNSSGWADTVWNGCYWKHVVDRVGPFREDMPRTEDNDFHARLRTLGYGLYLSPDILAFYVPRSTLRGLWRQYQSNGTGIIKLLISNPPAIGVRHLVPATFVASVAALAIAALTSRPARYALAALLAVYAFSTSIFTARAWFESRGPHVFFLPLVFVTLHVAYGVGALRTMTSPNFARRSFGQLIATVRHWKGLWGRARNRTRVLRSRPRSPSSRERRWETSAPPLIWDQTRDLMRGHGPCASRENES